MTFLWFVPSTYTLQMEELNAQYNTRKDKGGILTVPERV